MTLDFSLKLLATFRLQSGATKDLDASCGDVQLLPTATDHQICLTQLLCLVVVGFGVGKCSQLFVFPCLLCVCVVCCVLCVSVLLCAVLLLCCVVVVLCMCGGCVCSGPLGPPLRRTALRRTTLHRTAFRRTAQNFLFFPSPATIFILFSLSCWSFSLNFGGVFEDRGPHHSGPHP